MSEAMLREYVRFRGGASMLAGELAYPLGRAEHACLLFNPHPYMGGRMDNPLIARLAARLAECGAVTLRFDYAGVGNSDGPSINVAEAMARFWETGSAPIDPGMLEDGRAARDWLRRETGLPLALAGYSFGAHVADTLIDPHLRAVVMISPTITQHEYAQAAGVPIPKLVVHGDNDFATPRGDLEAWFAGLPEPKQLHRVPGGEHFFRGQEGGVAEICAVFVTEVFSLETCSP